MVGSGNREEKRGEMGDGLKAKKETAEQREQIPGPKNENREFVKRFYDVFFNKQKEIGNLCRPLTQ